MQLEHIYKEVMLAEVMPSVLKMVASVIEGQRPYCENVVSALLLKLSDLLSLSPQPPQDPDNQSFAAAAEVTPFASSTRTGRGMRGRGSARGQPRPIAAHVVS